MGPWKRGPAGLQQRAGCGAAGEAGLSFRVRAPSTEASGDRAQAGGCLLGDKPAVLLLSGGWETALPLSGKVSHCLSRSCQVAIKLQARERLQGCRRAA